MPTLDLSNMNGNMIQQQPDVIPEQSDVIPTRFANGLVNPDFLDVKPQFDIPGSQSVLPITSSNANSQEIRNAMTRDYFNYAFGYDEQNVADEYVESIKKGNSIAKRLAETYLQKNEWPNYGFDESQKESLLKDFTEKIQLYEKRYMEKLANNPNDPANKAILLRNFNDEYSKELQARGWPVTLQEGFYRMINKQNEENRDFMARTKEANQGNKVFSDQHADTKANNPPTGWWRSKWPWQGGSKTARNCIRGRNGKKTHARKLKRRSSKHAVRHRNSKRVRHTRRKQTRRHRR